MAGYAARRAEDARAELERVTVLAEQLAERLDVCIDWLADKGVAPNHVEARRNRDALAAWSKRANGKAFSWLDLAERLERVAEQVVGTYEREQRNLTPQAEAMISHELGQMARAALVSWRNRF